MSHHGSSEVRTSPFLSNLLSVKCKCGEKFTINLDDPDLKEHILSRCCNEEAPVKKLRKTIEAYEKYLEKRAELIGLGWDVDLPIDPCRQ